MFSNLRQHLCSFLYSPAKIHVSQAYIKLDMTRERVSFCLGSRNLLSPLQVDISFVKAVVARAIFERISRLELASEKLHQVFETCHPFYAVGIVRYQFGFLALISILYLVQILSKF